MDARRDKRLALVFLLPTLAIVLYWIFLGVQWLYHWFVGLPPYSAHWWITLGNFLWHNLSIVLAIYVVICLQVAGVAEFKYKRSFVAAFFLGLCLTPPIMMLVYGRRRA